MIHCSDAVVACWMRGMSDGSTSSTLYRHPVLWPQGGHTRKIMTPLRGPQNFVEFVPCYCTSFEGSICGPIFVSHVITWIAMVGSGEGLEHVLFLSGGPMIPHCEVQ